MRGQSTAAYPFHEHSTFWKLPISGEPPIDIEVLSTQSMYETRHQSKSAVDGMPSYTSHMSTRPPFSYFVQSAHSTHSSCADFFEHGSSRDMLVVDPTIMSPLCFHSDLHFQDDLDDWEQGYSYNLQSPTASSPATDLGDSNSPKTLSQYALQNEDHVTPGLILGNHGGNNMHHDTLEFDKPYAVLIWEALMAAPGHRMMLRDIYDYFLVHTSKAEESGTKGWQNSIRHNLSMNKAFENEKNDLNDVKGIRKASSTWILTDHAIKYGVESTTRYRKVGKVKQSQSNKVPAVQRQQSGAKGGRAARRAARLKRQKERNSRQPKPDILSKLSQIPRQNMSVTDTINHDIKFHDYEPVTPADDQLFPTCYTLSEQPILRNWKYYKSNFNGHYFSMEADQLHYLLADSHRDDGSDQFLEPESN